MSGTIIENKELLIRCLDQSGENVVILGINEQDEISSIIQSAQNNKNKFYIIVDFFHHKIDLLDDIKYQISLNDLTNILVIKSSVEYLASSITKDQFHNVIVNYKEVGLSKMAVTHWLDSAQNMCIFHIIDHDLENESVNIVLENGILYLSKNYIMR